MTGVLLTRSGVPDAKFPRVPLLGPEIVYLRMLGVILPCAAVHSPAECPDCSVQACPVWHTGSAGELAWQHVLALLTEFRGSSFSDSMNVAYISLVNWRFVDPRDAVTAPEFTYLRMRGVIVPCPGRGVEHDHWLLGESTLIELPIWHPVRMSWEEFQDVLRQYRKL